MRHCPDCGTKTKRRMTHSGLPRDVCPDCNADWFADGDTP